MINYENIADLVCQEKKAQQKEIHWAVNIQNKFNQIIMTWKFKLATKSIPVCFIEVRLIPQTIDLEDRRNKKKRRRIRIR